MRSGWTILTLLLLVTLAWQLRIGWPCLDRSAKLRWIGGSLFLLLARTLSDALRWEIASSRINDVLLWGRIAAYILLVVLFTRLRPRGLTVVVALVLLLPLFSATVYLPLELLFDPAPRTITHVGGRVVLEQIPWQRAGNDNRAVDYTISRRARWMPLLQHTFRVGRLYRTQCDTDSLSASLTPAGSVLLRCPSGAPGEPAVDEEIPLGTSRSRAQAGVVPSKP